MKLSHIRPQFVPMIAEDVAPYFKMMEDRTPDRSLHVHGIFHMIYSGQWSLWIIQDDDNVLQGVATSMVTTDMMGRRVAHIMTLSGRDWDKWGMEVLAEFERLAKENGAYSVEWEGRDAWMRKVPGYEVVRTVMRKVLTDGRRIDDNHSEN